MKSLENKQDRTKKGREFFSPMLDRYEEKKEKKRYWENLIIIEMREWVY